MLKPNMPPADPHASDSLPYPHASRPLPCLCSGDGILSKNSLHAELEQHTADLLTMCALLALLYTVGEAS